MIELQESSSSFQQQSLAGTLARFTVGSVYRKGHGASAGRKEGRQSGRIHVCQRHLVLASACLSFCDIKLRALIRVYHAVYL